MQRLEAEIHRADPAREPLRRHQPKFDGLGGLYTHNDGPVIDLVLLAVQTFHQSSGNRENMTRLSCFGAADFVTVVASPTETVRSNQDGPEGHVHRKEPAHPGHPKDAECAAY